MTFQQKAHELFTSGKEALAAGDPDKALKDLSMSLSYSGRTEAYLLKAKAQILKKDLKAALSEVESGLRACKPQEADLRHELEALEHEITNVLEYAERKRKKFESEQDKVREPAFKYSSVHDFAEDNVQPAIRLHFLPYTTAKKGNSQLGGAPLVPPDFVWPKTNGNKHPLSFIMQIDLEELEQFESASKKLPAKGMLLFFYDLVDWPSITETSGWRVIHFENKNDLQLCKTIEGEPLKPFRIRWEKTRSYPDPMSLEAESMERDVSREYSDEFFDDYLLKNKHHHQLFGHPVLEQGDPRENIETVATGVGKKRDEDLAIYKRVFTGCRRWQLLLQLDSDEYAGIQWGDEGKLYFYIDDEALGKGDFSRVRAVMDCS